MCYVAGCSRRASSVSSSYFCVRRGVRQRIYRTPLRSSPHVDARMRRHRRANGRLRARCGLAPRHPHARLAVLRYPPHYPPLVFTADAVNTDTRNYCRNSRSQPRLQRIEQNPSVNINRALPRRDCKGVTLYKRVVSIATYRLCTARIIDCRPLTRTATDIPPQTINLNL